MQESRQPQMSGAPTGNLTKAQQDDILGEIFGDGKPQHQAQPKRRPAPKVVEEDYYADEDYDEAYTDDRTVGCVCTDKCPNKTCIFYGRDNFLSINDIIETEIEDRIEYLIASGEIEDRRQDVRKQKLKKNRYLSDISESLLGLK